MQIEVVNARLLQLAGQHYHKQISEDVYRAQRRELLQYALVEPEDGELELLIPLLSETVVTTPPPIAESVRFSLPPWLILLGLLLLVLTLVAVVVLAVL
ncbi:MAG: hypothetical protein HKM02_06850 [Pseudomonadales bacterium]|nr:hypothetical protein [Pseudomonadales bacterium]